MALQKLSVDDLIKEIKNMVRDKQLTGFRSQAFYGEVTVKFQDGKNYVFEVRHTEKPE